MISRRSFLGQAAATGLAVTANANAVIRDSRRDSTYIELIRTPDSVTAFAGLDHRIPLERAASRFTASDVAVTIDSRAAESTTSVSAPATALTHLHLRWQCSISPALVSLGDHWERSYGDLAWRGITPERVMPWYFATHDASRDGSAVHAYGVKTPARALCFWQLDREGVSLWLDLRNGGDGVLLGQRQLIAATILSRRGIAGESPVAALRAFCQQMCPTPRLPQGAVYGGNDWYCAYGKNSQDMLLRIADLMAEVAPPRGPRPYTVVDMGWKENSPEFPSMAAFAEKVRQRNVRPGIWCRPLEAFAGTDEGLLLPAKRFGMRSERTRELAYDPTVPEASAAVQQKMRQLVDWKFDLVKHDFSTYDLLGQWGFEMGAQPSIPGWHFHDRSRTNAEIVLDLYVMLRGSLGENIPILGCNTIGHLAAGIFELQRTGDDTSGQMWERTRRMGVNTLAYRLPQHLAFFYQDADCIGITPAVPWELNRQWLDLVARTGTALFVSPAEGSVGPNQRAALKEAFITINAKTSSAEPVDFFRETTPELWRSGDGMAKRYAWCASEGASPFSI